MIWKSLVKTDPDQTRAVRMLSIRQDETLMSLLYSFHRKCAKGLADIVSTLHFLTESDKTFIWMSDRSEVFRSLKNA